MAFVGDDDYDYDRYRRGRSPRGYYDDYRRAQYLDPRPGGGLHRTRSTGHQPAPNIYIYNDQVQDAQQRSSSPYATYVPAPPPPPPAPPAPQSIPVPYAVPPPAQVMPQVVPVPYPVQQPAQAMPGGYPPPSPGYQGRRLGDELVEELAGVALHDRVRSRSRGRSEVGPPTDYYQWELARKEREIEEEKRKQLAEKEWELRRMREEEKRRKKEESEEAEQKRIVAEWEEKQRKKAAEAKEAEIKLREKLEREKREKKEEEDRMKAKFKAEEEEAKKREKEAWEEYERKQKQKEEEAKKKEKEAWEEYERKRKEKEEKAKADAKAEKEKFEHEMRKRLESFGVYSQAQIDYMVDEEKAKQYKERSRSRSRSHNGELEIWRPSRPVYPKIHRDYIEIETLIYYGIPYEYDRDANYIILKREMDKYETDVLFEHTRRIRSGDRTLLIEEPKKEKNYAWYRKRERSSSRVRKVGILEVRKVV